MRIYKYIWYIGMLLLVLCVGCAEKPRHLLKDTPKFKIGDIVAFGEDELGIVIERDKYEDTKFGWEWIYNVLTPDSIMVSRDHDLQLVEHMIWNQCDKKRKMMQQMSQQIVPGDSGLLHQQLEISK